LIVVDDNDAIRQGVRSFGWQVCSETRDGEDLIAKAKCLKAGRNHSGCKDAWIGGLDAVKAIKTRVTQDKDSVPNAARCCRHDFPRIAMWGTRLNVQVLPAIKALLEY